MTREIPREEAQLEERGEEDIRIKTPEPETRLDEEQRAQFLYRIRQKLRGIFSQHGYLSLFTESGEKYVCPVCGNDSFVYDYEKGVAVCQMCGTVVESQIIDLGPEWRTFSADERNQKMRTGAPIAYPVPESLTTIIDWKDQDVSGKALDIKRKLEIVKLRKWQTKSKLQAAYEKNFSQAIQELERLKNMLGVPKVCIDQALDIYRQAIEKDLIRGRSVEAVVAAALYMACRMLNMPRPLDEIAKYTKVGRRDIARAYRTLIRDLNVKVPISDPKLYVGRIVDMLKLPGEVAKTAIEILDEAKKRGITSGKDPVGLAAAAVYIAAMMHGYSKTQKEFAAMAGVTEVTVRNRYRELIRVLKLKVPSPNNKQ